MTMRGMVGIALVLGVAGSSVAQAAWGLKFEVSGDGGATWSNAVNALSGQTLKFRMGVYFDAGTQVTTADGTGNAVAVYRFTGSNEVTNLGAGDTIQNMVRTAANGTNDLIKVSGGTIGTTGVTSYGGQFIVEALPDPPQNYFQFATGELRVVDTLARVMTIRNASFGSFPVNGILLYNSASPVNKQFGQPDEPRTDLEASINVIPAPASLAVLGVAGVLLRRRRSACLNASSRA